MSSKLQATPSWFDGTLADNHANLLNFDYYNNEQSRLFQYLIPELLVQTLGLTVPGAYILQRWAFVALSYFAFYLYLQKWFSIAGAFAGLFFLAAVIPLTDMNHLQESAPLLMLLFLGGLWAIREERWKVFGALMLAGACTNETILCLSGFFFFRQLNISKKYDIWLATKKTFIFTGPSFLIAGVIRYFTRDRPHLGGAWHLDDNLRGIALNLTSSPLDYYEALHLFPFLIYGPLWVYAFSDRNKKPEFIASSLILVPLFIIPHLITGIITEVRQMIPLGFVIIPAAFYSLLNDNKPLPES